jgi:hypothetical protein
VTREDIYDHLAQVYLGKRKEVDKKKKKQFNAWLLINIVITIIIFASATYGLTAFLTQRGSSLRDSVIFSLHRGVIRLSYNFKDSLHPVESFSLSIPNMEVQRYHNIQFSIRAKEEGTPGIIKIVVKNKRNETAYCYLKGIGLSWRDVTIPLKDFKEITDWNSITDISFVIETWNVEKKKGIVLIEDVGFSS